MAIDGPLPLVLAYTRTNRSAPNGRAWGGHPTLENYFFEQAAHGYIYISSISLSFKKIVTL